MAVSLLKACFCHSLADSSVLDEVLFHLANLAIEKVVRLVDKAIGDVRDDFSWARFAEFAVGFVGRVGFASQLAHVERLLGGFAPSGKVAHAQKVFAVGKEFFEAGSSDVGQSDLGFLGGA